MNETRTTPPEVDFFRGARAVCRLALPMTLWSRRTLLITMLGIFLPLTAALFLAVKAIPDLSYHTPGYILYSNAIQIVQYYVMLIALFYGTAVVAEEIDGKTLTYLLVRPMPRSAILLGKGMAAWLIGALILVPLLTSTFVLFTLGDGLLYEGNVSSFTVNFPTLISDLALTMGTLAVYTALFTFIGTFFKRPVLWAIAIAFGWESWVAFVPGLTRKLTVMHYVQSLSGHASGRNIAVSILGQQTGTVQSILALVLIFALFTFLSAWVFGWREYFFDMSER